MTAFIQPMAVISKALKLFMLLACGFILVPAQALALTYKEALQAYTDQKYAKAYRFAIELAEKHDGQRRAKSLIVAAISLLELNKEERAIQLWKAARAIDPELGLPSIVKSKRVIKFFEDADAPKLEKENEKEKEKEKGKDKEIKPPQIVTVVSKDAFDGSDFETYLPFGLNQLLQGKPLTAVALGGVQVGSLYFAYAQSENAKRLDNLLAQKTAEVILSGDYETTEFKDFRSKSLNEARKNREASRIALASALASYTVSVLEIILNPPVELKVIQDTGREKNRAHRNDHGTDTSRWVLEATFRF